MLVCIITLNLTRCSWTNKTCLKMLQSFVGWLSLVECRTKKADSNMDDGKSAQTERRQTEALLFPFSSSLKPSTVPLPDSIILGSHSIPFSDSARNLGFILDSNLSMKKHVIKICQTAYFELKRIS